MESISLKARAKVNLALDVINRREDGYHNVRMVMQQICLYDRVFIISSDKKGAVSVECSHPDVPCDSRNIAYRAASLVRDIYGIEREVTIKIEKHIPVAAGLAGGSTDAAAVIKGLDRLWELNMQADTMIKMGSSLGADVPFCIMGGTALAEGIGDVLTPVRMSKELDLLLVKPDIMVSTAWAYNNLDSDDMKTGPDTCRMIQAIEKGDKRSIASEMANVLERVTVRHYPQVLQIKRAMLASGALGAVMTGSGPTVVGVYSSVQEAEHAAKGLRNKYRQVFVTKTC